MRTEQYRVSELIAFFKCHRVATLGQLQSALGDPTRRTVFRKLASLNCLTSYSHRGRYYTLPGIARFSPQGLWTYRSVWFSRFGNLIETVKAFVQKSTKGLSAAELRSTLHVETKHSLLHLVRDGQLVREVIHGRYIYFSAAVKPRRSQRKKREACPPKRLAQLIVTNPDLAVEEAKAVILLFVSTLDERQRRLFAGLESLKLGYGGDQHIAELFGIDPHTVARGREELLEGDWDADRLRKTGGGRPSVKKKRPRS